MYLKESHTIDFREESLNIFVSPTSAVWKLSHIALSFFNLLKCIKTYFSYHEMSFRPV